MYHVSTKLLCSTTVCNIDNNNKHLLSLNPYIIMISEDHATLKTGEMMLKIQLCITEINYILQYIKIVNIVTIFQNSIPFLSA